MVEFELVKVRDIFTLEQSGVSIVIDRKGIEHISTIEPSEDDISDYNSKQTDFVKLLENNSTSRRLVLSYEVKEDSDLNCISLIQVLLNRKENTLLAYLRSCNALKLLSDLGFLCKLAKMGECSKVLISIGSLHWIIE